MEEFCRKKVNFSLDFFLVLLFFTYDEIRANTFKFFGADSFYVDQIIYGSIGATGYNSFSKNRTDSFYRLKFFFTGSV